MQTGLLWLIFSSVIAQAAPGQRPLTRLLVTVVDQTGAVIQGARVSVSTTERTAPAVKLDRNADARGQVMFDLPGPGSYDMWAEHAGFARREVAKVMISAGDNKHVLILALQKIEQAVAVTRDPRDVALDRGSLFGSVLTREQILALSDDPAEMRRQLLELAGSDAIIRVDTFEGQALPPKAQIRSIRISRDQFAAENHTASTTVDIVTQPGVGALSGLARVSLHDGRLDGTNPFVNRKAPGRSTSGGIALGGTLVSDRADFSVSVDGADSWTTPIISIVSTSGPTSEVARLSTTTETVSASVLLNLALTRNQFMKFGASVSHSSRDNLGVGQYDLAERAHKLGNTAWGLRLTSSGPIGRRMFGTTRASINGNRSRAVSAVEARTLIVLDAFSSGGAQRSGVIRSGVANLHQEVDYVRGRHSVRAGVALEHAAFAQDVSTNYLGTYFFESVAAYNAASPSLYTQRIGPPSVSYTNTQWAAFVQDDFRLRRAVAVSFGIRYENQRSVNDALNFAPRVGIAWSPVATGRLTLRASWGMFYEWIAPSIYGDAAATVPGRIREVVIVNPSFPEPGSSEAIPQNSYVVDSSASLPAIRRLSVGASGTIRRLNLSATYSHSATQGLLLGVNLNAPVNGVRPDRSMANVIRATAVGAADVHSLTATASISFGGAGGSGFFQIRRRLGVQANGSVLRSRNNTDGPFAIAAGEPEAEWGPVGTPWSTSVSVSSGMIDKLGITMRFASSAGVPYSLRTGLDTNADGILNDRPPRIGRNSLRSPSTHTASLTFNYPVGLGVRRPVQAITGNSGVAASVQVPRAPRYVLNLNAQLDNILNRRNYTGYSGVMTSPYFLKPTIASGVRRITFSAGLSF